MFNTNANFHKQWHNDLPNNLKTTFYKLLNSSLIAVVAHVDFTCTSAGKVCPGPARHTGQPDLLWFLTALQADNAEFFLFLTFIFIFFCALLSFPLYIDKRCFVLLHWRIKFFLQSLILILFSVVDFCPFFSAKTFHFGQGCRLLLFLRGIPDLCVCKNFSGAPFSDLSCLLGQCFGEWPHQDRRKVLNDQGRYFSSRHGGGIGRWPTDRYSWSGGERPICRYV